MSNPSDPALVVALTDAIRSANVFDAALTFPEVSSRTIKGTTLADLLWDMSSRGEARGLSVRGLVVDGDIPLRHLAWRGPLEMVDCTINGDVRLSYATIQGELSFKGSEVGLLAINYARVEGRVACAGLVAHRGLFALGCHITGSLTLQRAVLSAPPEAERMNRAALDAYRAVIGDLYANGAVLKGGFYALGATFDRNVRLSGAQVWPRAALGWEQGPDAGDGVDLTGATVGSSIYLWSTAKGPLVLNGGTVRLRNVSCRNLRAQAEQLGVETDLEGLTYSNISPVTGAQMLAALDAQTPSPRKGYAQLASHAELIGDPGLKKAAMVHQQRRVGIDRRWTSPSRLRHSMYGLLAGYGYAPGRALGWLLACLALATALIKSQGTYIHADDGVASLQSWPAALAYTLDQIMPFASSGYSDLWSYVPVGGGAWLWYYVFIMLKFASWALAALALAAVTGLIRAK